MTARKNGRGGGPKKRTQWRPEKTDPVAARKNGRGGGPKKRARWRPEKTDPLAARKNGKTARKNAPKTDPKTDPKTCPKNGPKTARKNGTLGLFVWFSRFSRFSRGPGNLPEKRETPFFQGPIAPVFGARRWFFQGALSAYVNGFFQDVFEASLGRGPVRPREGAAVGEVRADGRERQERQRRR